MIMKDGLIKVIKLTSNELCEMDVDNWPIWEKEESAFQWHYDEMEQFYLIEGNASLKADGKKVEIKPGDFVICSKGLDCEWTITSYIKKHYHFVEE